MEGEGKALRGFIIERRKGTVSWIRFGEGELRNFLKGIVFCCREGNEGKRSFDWKENGRSYKMESLRNNARKYLVCAVTDGEGKRHKIFILEGRGLLKGWDLLTAKFRELGVQEKTNEKRDGNKARENDAKDVNLDDFGKKGFST